MTIGISGMASHPSARRRENAGVRRRRAIVVSATLVALGLALASMLAVSALAMTSHAGWPTDQHLVMDRGPAGRHHVLRGRDGVHNYLLGGFGDDTIYGGSDGDVIWGDYHPSGWPAHQTAVIHAGDGKNYIYANDTLNYVWTGTNPDRRARARGLRRHPLPEPQHRRVHQPPRPPPLRAARLPAHQLLLRRVLSGTAGRVSAPAPHRLTVRIPCSS
jgi:hypothetical protein